MKYEYDETGRIKVAPLTQEQTVAIRDRLIQSLGENAQMAMMVDILAGVEATEEQKMLFEMLESALMHASQSYQEIMATLLGVTVQEMHAAADEKIKQEGGNAQFGGLDADFDYSGGNTLH